MPGFRRLKWTLRSLLSRTDVPSMPEQSSEDAVRPRSGPSRVAYRLAHESAVGQIGRAVESVRSYQQRSVLLLSATLVMVGLVADTPELRDGLAAGGCLVALGTASAALGIAGAFTGTVLLNRPLSGNFEPTVQVIIDDYGDDSKRFFDEDSVYRELALHAGRAAEAAETQCALRARWMRVCLAAPGLLVLGLTIIVAHG